MRTSLLALALSAAIATSLQADSPLTFYLSNANGNTGAALPNTYAFSTTPQASASSVILKVVNTSANAVDLAQILVTQSASSTASSPDFTVTGFFSSGSLAPGSSTLFTVNFAPVETGAIVGYLQFAYRIEQGNCTSTSPLADCPSTIATASILTGTATGPQLVLSYSTSAGSVVLQPDSTTPIQFGNVPDCASSAITFTLQNQTAFAAPAPAISLTRLQFIDSAFALDTSTLGSTIAANSSATFAVTLAPGQAGVYSASLMVGSNSYPIQGASVDPLEIKYVDTTGVGELAQTATPIVFGNLVAGVNGSSVLNFMLTNPSTSTGPITLPVPTISGNGFAISGAPAAAVTLQPGDPPLAFQLTFSANAPGMYTGTLSIGCRQFTLSGQSVSSPFPTFSFQLSSPALTSQQQVNLTIQFASPSTIPAVGTLTMQFTPSVANVGDDPAIFFTATSGRTLNISVATGSSTATFQGQPNLTFQTGTTAGAIVFTLALPNTASISSPSFTIQPATIQITSAQAVRQNPNLIVTINGYDNTYSAGALSFTFYDVSGRVITPNGIAVNATSNFHQYFFTNNANGGAFALQASFPVTGDVTQVGSVAATLTNSIGQSSTTQTLQ
jgi:hypothetical protein